MTKITSFDLTPFYRNTVGIDSLFDRITRNIQGSRNDENRQEVEYLHHGISNRNFLRTFVLQDYVEVQEALMKDGILTIKLERIIPEAMKPKKIAITYQS